MCQKLFSVAHGGKDDCCQHTNSTEHKEYALAPLKMKDLGTFFVFDNDTNVIKKVILYVLY